MLRIDNHHIEYKPEVELCKNIPTLDVFFSIVTRSYSEEYSIWYWLFCLWYAMTICTIYTMFYENRKLSSCNLFLSWFFEEYLQVWVVQEYLRMSALADMFTALKSQKSLALTFVWTFWSLILVQGQTILWIW